MIEGAREQGIPLLIELALIHAERHGDYPRRRPVPPNQPSNGFGYRLAPLLEGDEIAARLSAISWSLPDFARFTGLTDRSMRDIVKGRRDRRLTALFGFALELAEWHPLEMQARQRVLTRQRQSPARRAALSRYTTPLPKSGPERSSSVWDEAGTPHDAAGTGRGWDLQGAGRSPRLAAFQMSGFRAFQFPD
jgi:hypothetical protein